MAWTSSLNYLYCRDPYQTPHSLNASPLFTEEPVLFTKKCFVASPSQKSVLFFDWGISLVETASSCLQEQPICKAPCELKRSWSCQHCLRPADARENGVPHDASTAHFPKECRSLELESAKKPFTLAMAKPKPWL